MSRDPCCSAISNQGGLGQPGVGGGPQPALEPEWENWLADRRVPLDERLRHYLKDMRSTRCAMRSLVIDRTIIKWIAVPVTEGQVSGIPLTLMYSLLERRSIHLGRLETQRARGFCRSQEKPSRNTSLTLPALLLRPNLPGCDHYA